MGLGALARSGPRLFLGVCPGRLPEAGADRNAGARVIDRSAMLLASNERRMPCATS